MLENEASQEMERASFDFEFKQRLGEVNLDQTKYSKISQNIERFQNVIFNNFDYNSKTEIQSALIQMIDLHKDQKDRPDGMPYVSHPLEVSRSVIEDFGVMDKDLVIAALLHDTVEDQAIILAREELEAKYGAESINDTDFLEQNQNEVRELAFSRIERDYGLKVVLILRKLTNPDFDAIASERADPQNKELFVSIKNELYKEHVTEAITDPDTLVIKLADFIHNTSDASKLPESSQKNKYRMKYIPVVSVFIDRLQRKDLPCPIADKEAVIKKLNNIAEELNK